MVNGALPLTMSVAGTEPTPMNTRKAVPITSAASFWRIDGSSIPISSVAPGPHPGFVMSMIIR